MLGQPIRHWPTQVLLPIRTKGILSGTYIFLLPMRHGFMTRQPALGRSGDSGVAEYLRQTALAVMPTLSGSTWWGIGLQETSTFRPSTFIQTSATRYAGFG